jgi:hypothetical protein
VDLLKKRDALIAEHQAQEKYDPHWKAEAEKGRKLSERPIAFICDDTVIVPGEECIRKIFGGLKRFLDIWDAAPDVASKKAATEPAFAQALAKARQACRYEGPLPHVSVPQQVWNAYLYALNSVGLEVVISDGGAA